MPASSQRYGFKVPASPRVAMAIRDGAHLGRTAAAAAGPLLNIGSGDPGFVTPAHVREAAKRAIAAGKIHDERNVDLKGAIAAKLAGGVHVMMEKPIATTLPGAHRIVAAARGAGIPLATSFVHRFREEAVHAKRFVEAGGPLQVGRETMATRRTPAHRKWLTNATMVGGDDETARPHSDFERQAVDFLVAIEAGRDPSVTGKDGLRALDICLAVYRSAATGRPVVLDAFRRGGNA